MEPEFNRRLFGSSLRGQIEAAPLQKEGAQEDNTSRPALTAFEQDLRRLINKHCVENESNTPDLILAEYLNACLASFNVATQQREKWYGRKVF